MKFLNKKRKIILISVIGFIIILLVSFFFYTKSLSDSLIYKYKLLESHVVFDRNGKILKIIPNERGYYSIYTKNFPKEIKDLILSKEDKYYYYHFGINPFSILEMGIDKIEGKGARASSTVDQQLAKILLGNENERSIGNKLEEMLYATALDIHNSKEDILDMYLNSIYLGNLVSGLEMASNLYFDKDLTNLSKEEIFKILATISSPSNVNPYEFANIKAAERLAKALNVKDITFQNFDSDLNNQNKNSFKNYIKSDANFELANLNIDKNDKLTIDSDLTSKIREILQVNLRSLENKDVKNGAVVIIKYPENELLTIVGSPDPTSSQNGMQLNMANMPRPIGSTLKPFIYTYGFSKGLRPYSLVDDREYKFEITGGEAFYPKNYDYLYHGIVNLHFALSNSLNVPAVKVLNFIGIKEFNDFITNEFEYKPIEPIENYQLGFALGHLDMELMRLAYYFSIFTHNGNLIPLKISDTRNIYNLNKNIFNKKYIELVNSILIDRKTGVEQFGAISNLNTFGTNIAIKTGTSREYHDSWVVGFTPDFLIAVWVGNADNSAMDDVSGSIGAGQVWHDAMEYMLNTKYNKQTKFNFSDLKEFQDGENTEYGLASDDFEKSKNLLIDNELIFNPHEGDIFKFQEGMTIVLKSASDVVWFVDDKEVGQGKEVNWKVSIPGKFQIKAKGETIEVKVER